MNEVNIATGEDGRRRVTPILQTAIHVRMNGDDGMRHIQRTVSDWIQSRPGVHLTERPDDLWTFEGESVGQFRVSAVEIRHPPVWAARLDLEDQTFARTWITEIGVWDQGQGQFGFACRLQCVAATHDTQVNYSIPNIVRRVCELGLATLDGRELSAEPWFVASPAAVQMLVRFLAAPTRTAQVIVFSLAEDSVDPSKTVIPLDRLCNDLLGVAHVVILTGPAAFALTATVGRGNSVFNQAVRV